MADTWELTKYVESHPNNHGQRWRLIKKLYKDADYRMALENLHILINDWDPKPNVFRYQAATYTRLSRPEEAIRILKKGANLFPTDMGLREQLAIAYMGAGHDELAIDEWRSIVEDSPDHRFATKAIKKISKRLSDDHEEKISAQPVSDGIVCRTCGAWNAPEALCCEVCESSIDMLDDIVEETETTIIESVDKVRGLMWGSILVSSTFIGYSVFSAMGRATYGIDSPYATAVSVSEFMRVEYQHLMLLLTAVLIVAWPLLLVGAYRAIGMLSMSTDKILRQGLAFSTFGVAFAWIAGVGIIEWVPVVLAVSLGGIIAGLKDNIKMAVGVWAIQAGFLGILIVTLVGAIMGSGFLSQSISIDQIARKDTDRNALHLVGALNEPRAIQWYSSGSTWLDEHAPRVGVRLSVDAAMLEQEMTLVVKQGDALPLYERVYDTEQFFYLENIEPGSEYTIELLESGSDPVRIDIVGLLPVETR